jgi:hypothetical protein
MKSFVASIPQPGGTITGFTNFEPSLVYRGTERISSNVLLNALEVGGDPIVRQKVAKRKNFAPSPPLKKNLSSPPAPAGWAARIEMRRTRWRLVLIQSSGRRWQNVNFFRSIVTFPRGWRPEFALRRPLEFPTVPSVGDLHVGREFLPLAFLREVRRGQRRRPRYCD